MNPYSSSTSFSKRKKNPNDYHDEMQPHFSKPKNDVLISFSEDIGKSFISHLTGALKRHSFSVIDHTMLPICEDVCSETLKAIEESEIYVLVFSNNYAFSIRCLDELVDIMDCFRKFHQRKILPVFYKVEPSDVRKQQGPFNKAFGAHEIHFDVERVQEWRQALKDAAQLSGFKLLDGDNEDKFVCQIVKELENMQNPQELYVTDYPIGIEPRVCELISTLRMDLENVFIVAVLGISGIGKSTIVRATYNKIAAKFDKCCFFADVHQHCPGSNWESHLQKELISCLTQNDKFPIMHSHNHGVSKIRKLISGRKVLLVLDDVDNFEQLQALGIHPASFAAGSKIIVTTRDKRALGILPHASHKIRFLNRRESLELFTRLTFEKDDIVDKKLVKEIVRCAGGLPLVLEVWSRHFKHHEREQWPDLLEMLKIIPHDDVQKQLRISYDSLNKRAQKLFLDIACFFDGMYKDLAVKLLLNKETAFFPVIQIQDLADKGLVKRGALLLMLHAIRDMGKEIVRQESEDEPGLRSRLRDRRDVLHVLTECSGTESVESIRLDFEKKEEVITVQVEAFRKMSNLRLIQLLDPQLSWTCSTDDMPSFSFKKLKYLEWYGFPLECINIDMHNVEVVRLENSKLEILWEGVKSLKKLRILDVNGSSSLTKTGNFNGLENLEELRCNGCSTLEELHNSIGCLEKLAIMYLNDCTRLTSFPWEMIVKLKSLQKIDLSRCPNIGLDRDEVINTFLSSLKHCLVTQLHLAGCKILKISHELGSLKWLTHLNLSENKFSTLPDNSLSELHDLDTIDLSSCSNLMSIPDLPPKITSLRARNCISLVKLPSNMSELTVLTKVWLCGCSKLGSEDPECLIKIVKLRGLGLLSMENCNVSHVPREIENLKLLQILELSGNTFSSLPDTFSNLRRLYDLKINDCSLLERLPLLPSNLTMIQAFRCFSLDLMPLDWMAPIPCDTQASKVYKKLPFPRGLCISITGDVIPNWCSYQYRGHILSFVAPAQLDKKISGAIICTAIQVDQAYLWSPSAIIYNKTKETCYCATQLINSNCGMFVKFFPLDDDTVVVEAGDIVVVEFLGKYAPERIIGCGLRLTYEGDLLDTDLVIKNVIEPTPSIPSEMSSSITDIWSESDDDFY